MHYFPSWSEDFILWELSYKKYLMYLASIPDYSEGNEGEETQPGEPGADKPKAPSPTPKKVGSFNLFDMDTRHKQK